MSTDRLRMPTGEVVDVIASGRDTGGAVFELEGTLPPRAAGPPVHRHRRQAEEFTVLEGVLRVRVGPWHRDLGAGESVLVPPGTTHGFANPTDAVTRFHTAETPADQLEEQMRLMAASGRVPPLLGLARINVEHDLSFELHGLPGALQRPLWRALAWVDRRRRPV